MDGKSTIRLTAGRQSRIRPSRKIPTHYCFAFLLFLLVDSIHCKKSPPPQNILPPATQEGKNTFGCTVNGETWIPYYQCGILLKCKELQAVVSSVDTIHKLPIDVKLTTLRKIGDGSISAFSIYAGITHTGKDSSSFYLVYTRDSVSYYQQDPPRNTSNAINITRLDTVNQIISGTFFFTLYNAAGDSVIVKDGRFDIAYNACLCH